MGSSGGYRGLWSLLGGSVAIGRKNGSLAVWDMVGCVICASRIECLTS